MTIRLQIKVIKDVSSTHEITFSENDLVLRICSMIKGK